MTEEQKQKTLKALVLIGLVAVAVYGFITMYTEEKLEDVQSSLLLNISNQETKMITLTERIAQDGGDSVVNKIIVDCELAKRERFDTLLSNLANLNRSELIEIRSLFGSCASFYTDRRAIMSARLSREVEVYNEYIALLDLVDTDETEVNNRTAQWHTLSELETERSQLMSQLVTIQEEIIESLYSGQSIESESIKTALAEAQNTKENVLVLTSKIDTLRTQLSKL